MLLLIEKKKYLRTDKDRIKQIIIKNSYMLSVEELAELFVCGYNNVRYFFLGCRHARATVPP